jgi:very-short-patch-repair endonuclease
LAVELDGGQLNLPEGREYDAARTNYLNAHGVEVVRFWNNEVSGEMDGVLACLELKAISRTSYPPVPRRGG